MNEHLSDHQLPVDALHPKVYVTLVALTAWFVLAVWMLFGANSYTSVTDTMITFLFTMAIGIPTLIWLTWSHHPEAHSDEADKNAAAHERAPAPFDRWAAGEFRTWTGGQKAWQAAIEVLLPIAAVAIGITAFGLVYVLTSPGMA